MTVYVVYEPCGIGEITKGVCSSKEKAEDAAAKCSGMGRGKHYIDEYELDEVKI